jgi:hypothetical protein
VVRWLNIFAGHLPDGTTMSNKCDVFTRKIDSFVETRGRERFPAFFKLPATVSFPPKLYSVELTFGHDVDVALDE